MNALVTGAGGFLGLYVVEQLTARGDRVRALCRGSIRSSTPWASRPSAPISATGRPWSTPAAGMDAVFHIGGMTGHRRPVEGLLPDQRAGHPARRRRMPRARRRPAGLYQQPERHFRRPQPGGGR